MPAPETAPATITVQPTSRLNRIGSIMDTRLSAGVALPVLEFCGDVVTIHAGDEIERDFLGTNGFAFAVHRAAAEMLFHHFHHADDAVVAFGLALREEAEVGDFRGREELRGTVGTLRDAGAALDAFGGVHRALLHRLRNQQRVRFDGAAGVDGDVAAGLDDLVERAAVDDEVLDDREGARAPRLDADFVAVAEVAHVQLAGGGAADRAVRDAVDHHAARAADAFAAIVFEMDRLLAALGQLFVDDVEHLQKRRVGADTFRLVGDEFAVRGARGLPPDL